MPFTHDNFQCPACSQYHVLFWATDEAPTYETSKIQYKCPENQKTVQIPNPQFAWSSVSSKPDRAVGVR